MRIDRVWAMPNRWTFQIKPIAKLLKEEMSGAWADPFAGMNSPAGMTNDLNPDMNAESHLDALAWLSQFEDREVDGVLFDPPYNLSQLKECYTIQGMALDLKIVQGKWGENLKQEISRIVKPGGKVISFGWNSNGIGKTLGFKLLRILLVAHGGSHNDTIVTVERKMNGSLF